MSPHDRLAALMAKNTHNENTCKLELEHAQEMLVHHETPEVFVKFEPEYPGYNGYTDLVVSCKREDDTGDSKIHAYIWEAKSPQSFIFEADTKHRVKPSKELISAENQLLHYYYTNKGADSFRRHFSLISDSDIHFGGIIIGQKSTLVKNSNRIRYTESQKQELYRDALDYRKQALWNQSGIKLITWDRVLGFLQRPSTSPVPSKFPAQAIKAQSVDEIEVELES